MLAGMHLIKTYLTQRKAQKASQAGLSEATVIRAQQCDHVLFPS